MGVLIFRATVFFPAGINVSNLDTLQDSYIGAPGKGRQLAFHEAGLLQLLVDYGGGAKAHDD